MIAFLFFSIFFQRLIRKVPFFFSFYSFSTFFCLNRGRGNIWKGEANKNFALIGQVSTAGPCWDPDVGVVYHGSVST